MSEPTSTKPYLLRAVYEWCVDNGFTPYITVVVDPQTRVPMEYVRDGEIVLNIGPVAASHLKMGNDVIEFSARFSGVAKAIAVPVATVAAIYARENEQGLSFELRESDGEQPGGPAEITEPPKSGGRPTLKRVK
jgi:stringent starvation protein B